MVKLIRIGLVVIISMLISGCSEVNDGEGNHDIDQEKVSFQATILENQGTYLVVQPDKNSQENSSADIIHVSVSEAKLLDEKAEEVTIEEFEIDMEINIQYNGMIAESYPAQIHKVYEIKILSTN